LNKEGVKRIAQKWFNRTENKNKEYIKVDNFDDLDELKKLADAVASPSMTINSVLEDSNRLRSMGIETPEMERAALREFIQYRAGLKEADKAKMLERSLIGKNVGFDFFPTPKATAETMVQEADISEGMDVLEPSAGNGNIAEVIRDAGVKPDVAELSGSLREVLEAKGFNIVAQDFMDIKAPVEPQFKYEDYSEWSRQIAKTYTRKEIEKEANIANNNREQLSKNHLAAVEKSTSMSSNSQRRAQSRNAMTGNYERYNAYINALEIYDYYPEKTKEGGTRKEGKLYDRIIMNPPFSNSQDIEHVQHAYDLLKPNGKLVAIMGEGAFFRSDKKATEFREWLDKVGGTSEKLPEGTFTDKSLMATTGVNARMVIIDKSVPTYSRIQELNRLGRQLTRKELAEYADELIGWGTNTPPVVVVNTVSELPFDALEDAQGVFHMGKIFLVADNILSTEDANGVIFHEVVGHYGLRGFFGSTLDSALDDIHLHNPLIQKYARNWRNSNLDLKEKYSMSEGDYWYRSIEEAMAEMAQENKPYTFADRLINAIELIDKNFLLFIGSIGNGLLCVKNILPLDVGYGADDRVEGTLRHPSF